MALIQSLSSLSFEKRNQMIFALLLGFTGMASKCSSLEEAGMSGRSGIPFVY